MITNETRIHPGDVITARCVSFVVGRILYQDYWSDEGYDVEFIDDFGNYHHWKQYEDGGDVTRAQTVVNFKWDMRQEELTELYSEDRPESGYYDYCGAVFFGDFKLEFIHGADGNYCNWFQYDMKDGEECLADGTPYGELIDESEAVRLPDNLPSFRDFAELIESQVMRLIREIKGLTLFAYKPTDPDKWYPDGHPYKIEEITRNEIKEY